VIALLVACRSVDPGPATLDCATAIDAIDELPADYAPVLDALALDTRLLGVTDTGDRDPRAALHAKTGLVVRTGVASTIVVPADQRDGATIGWGNVDRTWELSVPACDGDAAWQAFAGGVLVDRARCVPLEVAVGDERADVGIAVGADCR
jgi:hypothetical protein